MKIKEKKRSNFLYYLKKILNFICRWLFNKKTKIFFGIIIIIILLLIGILFGLFISNYFGTLDNPSQRALDIAHYFGILNLREIKASFEAIKEQNIMIPINYVRGQFSNPEKIYIDIGFTDYQKLAYKRQQALENQFLSNVSGADYVPAKIRYKDKEINIELRLKGDLQDHWEGNKWSFRIKVKGNDTLFGMKIFSIQDPKTRIYLNEFIYHEALKREGVLAPRYYFIEAVINGENKGIYALEEHFTKELIENNNRREGVIVKFDEDLMWEQRALTVDYFSNLNELFNYTYSTILNSFYISNIETFDDRILEDPKLSVQFEKARGLLDSFRKGSLEPHKIFDVDTFSRYFAINTLTGSQHSSSWNNIRLYYNPVTSLLEPIGFDANVWGGEDITGLLFPDCLSNEYNCHEKPIENWYDPLFRDPVFFEKYIKELEKMSEESYLDNLFLELDDEIKRNLNILHKDYPACYFPKENFYRNQKRIRNKLNPIQATNTYFQKDMSSKNKLVLYVGNIQSLPLEIINVVYNDSIIFEPNQNNGVLQPKADFDSMDYQKFEFKIPGDFMWNDSFASNLKINYKIFGLEKIISDDVFPWSYIAGELIEKDFIRQKSIIEENSNSIGENSSSIDFLNINNKTKKIIINKGNWELNQDLIIPKGYSVFIEKGTIINFINNAMILSYSDLQLSGTKEEPIMIISSDKTGQGLTLLNTDKVSNLNNIIFNGLTSPSKRGWELTGAINFYKSPVKLNNVVIKNMNSEDSLNIINSEFEIKDSTFESCSFDCFDNDFSRGLIIDSSFINCGNDCIDISGAETEITNIDIINAGDKGVSIGEVSYVKIENIKIGGNELNKTYIGIASKDQSEVLIKNSQISNCEYGLAVYQKKPEFGPASIEAIDTEISQVVNNYIIEKNSNLLIDGIIILKKENEVYKKLYEL